MNGKSARVTGCRADWLCLCPQPLCLERCANDRVLLTRFYLQALARKAAGSVALVTTRMSNQEGCANDRIFLTRFYLQAPARKAAGSSFVLELAGSERVAAWVLRRAMMGHGLTDSKLHLLLLRPRQSHPTVADFSAHLTTYLTAFLFGKNQFSCQASMTGSRMQYTTDKAIVKQELIPE